MQIRGAIRAKFELLFLFHSFAFLGAARQTSRDPHTEPDTFAATAKKILFEVQQSVVQRKACENVYKR